MLRRNRLRKKTVENKPFRFTAWSDAAPKIHGADIWLLDFTTLTENQIAHYANLLSPKELTRAQNFKRNQHHFLATRALMRKVLALYTGLSPNALEFARREAGKPYLINSPNPMYFNLSHSGNFAALAVSTLGEIGVDTETIRQRNFLAIAERYFHEDEFTQLLEKQGAEQALLFFKLWTLKEAFFKATGGGISSGLEKAVFNVDNKNIRVQLAPELNETANTWQFKQELITPTTLVALAVNTTEIIEYQWFDGRVV